MSVLTIGPRIRGFYSWDAVLVQEQLHRMQWVDRPAYEHVCNVLREIRPATLQDPCSNGTVGCTKQDFVARLVIDQIRSDPDEVLLTIFHESAHYYWDPTDGWLYYQHKKPLIRKLDPVYAAEDRLRVKLLLSSR